MDIRLISKFGYIKIAVCGVLFILSVCLNFLWILFGLLFVFMLWFYRNPERECSEQKSAVFSPVDAKVVAIRKVAYENEEFVEVLMKKRFWGVGVLRSPFDAADVDVKFRGGLGLYSTNQFTNLLNRRTSFAGENEEGKRVVVRFFDGIFGSIKFTKKQNLVAGRRMGFMRDGKVGILVPLDYHICVDLGTKVRACGQVAYRRESAEVA